jgi:hypothetical protein
MQQQHTVSHHWLVHCAGLSKTTLEQQGISCQQAFGGLVSFVNSKTQLGQTPAIVAHGGFAFHFPFMEAALLRSMVAASAPQLAAAAAAAAGNSSNSDTSSSTSRRRRRRRNAQGSAETPSSSSSSSSSAISTAPAAAVHTGWPHDWLFHDTLLLTRCLKEMQPPGSPLAPKLSNHNRGECSSSRATGYACCNCCALGCLQVVLVVLCRMVAERPRCFACSESAALQRI